MTFFANVVRVLIASPSDIADLRDAVERALHEWNGDRAAAASVILLPRRWETNAIPELTGEDGQSVINRQLVDDADVVIGIFHSRLGRETPRYASGTAEELDRAKNDGKRVHVYFSSMPIERDHADPQALAALAEFKKEIEKLGLYGSFDTPASLKDQVKSAIEADIVALDLSAPIPSRAARRGAALRVEYGRDREPNNKGRLTTRRERLVITNTGDVDAVDVTLELEPIGEGIAPTMWDSDGPFTVAANSGSFAIPIMTHSGTANSAQVKLHWTEDGSRVPARSRCRSSDPLPSALATVAIAQRTGSLSSRSRPRPTRSPGRSSRRAGPRGGRFRTHSTNLVLTSYILLS